MKKMFLVPFLAIPMSLIGCQENSANQAVNRKVTKVNFMQVTSIPLSMDKRYSGTVEESNGTSLSFSVLGTIDRIYVKTGDRVVKGQIIASIDTTTFKSSYNVAKASLCQAQDAYNRLKVLYEENSLPEIKWVDVQSKLQQAQAMEEVAEKKLNDCFLKAPFSGVIADKKVEIGQNVAPGVPVAELVSMQQVKIKVFVPESDINDIQIGNKTTVIISAADDMCFEGNVVEKGIVANSLSRSYEVKIMVENINNQLLPGMVTDVFVMGEKCKTAIVLPANVIQIDEHNKTFVWVNQGGMAIKRFVTCGKYIADGIVIESGLQTGDEIVVSGQHKVCEGTVISL